MTCRTVLLAFALLCSSVSVAEEDATDARPGIAPDIREDESKLKVQRGNFVVVPIPISNPTLEEGIVAGAAYFYPQSEEQKKLQPASLTAAAGMYTNNNSRALALVQQNYWKNNRWRFTGAVGGADLRLSLLTPDDTSSGTSVDWRINGKFLFAKLARRIKGDWYGGVLTRLIDASQNVEWDSTSPGFDTGSDILSAGLGAVVEYDTRDNPFNATSGQHLTVDALFNEEAIGSDFTYQSYGASYRSYHRR